MESVPQACIGHIQAQLLFCIVGYHSTVSWQYRVHTQLLHAGQNLLLQLLLSGVPRCGQRSTPSFKVIHLPPCQESRSGNKLAHLFLAVSQLQQHVSPHALLTYNGKWQIYSVQSHPVYFLLPAVPIPERHRIAECAVVKIITQSQVGLVTFLLLNFWHHSGQLCLHLVPTKVYPCVILQIPVESRCDVYPCVSTNHHLLSLLVELKKVFFALNQLGFKLL